MASNILPPSLFAASLRLRPEHWWRSSKLISAASLRLRAWHWRGTLSYLTHPNIPPAMKRERERELSRERGRARIEQRERARARIERRERARARSRGLPWYKEKPLLRVSMTQLSWKLCSKIIRKISLPLLVNNEMKTSIWYWSHPIWDRGNSKQQCWNSRQIVVLKLVYEVQ